MRFTYFFVATGIILSACGGGIGEPDNAAKSGVNGAMPQDGGVNASAACQGGMTAAGNLCAAKPHSPSPVLETM